MRRVLDGISMLGCLGLLGQDSRAKIQDLIIGVFFKAQQDLMKTRRGLDSICQLDGFRRK
jgi:hypothetical protein